MQRRRSTRGLKEGSSVNVSALAFIIRLPMVGSAAQCGINPQCMSLHSLPPLCRTMTGIVGEVCSGAMLKRGVYFGRSWSRFQRTRMSLNSNVAVKRPHILNRTYVLVDSAGQRANQHNPAGPCRSSSCVQVGPRRLSLRTRSPQANSFFPTRLRSA